MGSPSASLYEPRRFISPWGMTNGSSTPATSSAPGKFNLVTARSPADETCGASANVPRHSSNSAFWVSAVSPKAPPSGVVRKFSSLKWTGVNRRSRGTRRARSANSTVPSPSANCWIQIAGSGSSFLSSSSGSARSARLTDPSGLITARASGASSCTSLNTKARSQIDDSSKSTNSRRNATIGLPSVSGSDRSLISACSLSGLMVTSPSVSSRA